MLKRFSVLAAGLAFSAIALAVTPFEFDETLSFGTPYGTITPDLDSPNQMIVTDIIVRSCTSNLPFSFALSKVPSSFAPSDVLIGVGNIFLANPSSYLAIMPNGTPYSVTYQSMSVPANTNIYINWVGNGQSISDTCELDIFGYVANS